MIELEPARTFVERMLNLSTGHLPPHLLPLLANDGLDVLTYPNTYGGLVLVDEFSEHPSLMEIFKLARELECVWVRFDTHGPQVSELEAFDHD